MPEMINEFKCLLKMHRDGAVNIHLCYDTTFKLGDFYVNSLIFRHTLLTSDLVMPIAFVIHERKFQFVHERFFERVSAQVPELKERQHPSHYRPRCWNFQCNRNHLA